MKFRVLQDKIEIGRTYYVDSNTYDGYVYKGRVKVLDLAHKTWKYAEEKGRPKENCKWWKCELLNNNNYFYPINIPECYFKIKHEVQKSAHSS